MKTRLEQIFDRFLNTREVAIWGNPTRSLLRILKPYKFHIAENVDPAKHYVVAVTEDDAADFEIESQGKSFKEYLDYAVYDDIGAPLPFEWELNGVKIGRQAYFGRGVVNACKAGTVERIGHFTSINGSAIIQVNHQLDMTFTSDDIQYFFNEESNTKFQAALKADPAHPYAYSKPKLTIGNDVYIGAFAFINASKVTCIGDGAIIGSGAVVLEDVPPYAVVVGAPAKIKRYRFSPEMIKTLLQVKWWNWSEEEINANIDALISPEALLAKYNTANVHKFPRQY